MWQWQAKSQAIRSVHTRFIYSGLLFLTGLWLLVLQPVYGASRPPAQRHTLPGIGSAVGFTPQYVDEQFAVALQAYKNDEFVLSMRLFRLLADFGDARAEYYLGLHYDTGAGVNKDALQASYWYTRAAEKGFARAQHNLAVAYARGEGVPANIHTALRWWLKAANQGNTDSAYNLGILYALGHKDLAPDYARAMHWWYKAAVSGDAYAQFNLGTMYANGGSGKQNYCAALHWWQLSAENGVAEAARAIELTRQHDAYQKCAQKTNPDTGKYSMSLKR